MERLNKSLALVALGAVVALTSFGASVAPTEAGNLRLKKKTHQAVGGGAIGGYTGGFALNCAPGFGKAGEKEKNGWTDWYVCSTGVITCPTQVQSNGLKSSVHPQAIIQQVGGDPDGGTVKFRVQYKCDYGWTAHPEG